MAVAATSGQSTAVAARTEGYPQSSVRFDWVVAGLTVWLISGLFIDGWAHSHGQVDNTFFTPWHAILYSGVFVLTLFLGVNYVRHRLAGYRFMRALPVGYMVSFLGAGLFMLVGGFDFVWHSLFGFEVDLETLLSPAHILLATTGFMIITGPIRSAWAQYPEGTAPGWRKLGPVVIAATATFSVLTFFTDYANAVSRASFATASKEIENTRYSDQYVMHSDGSRQTRLTGIPGAASWGGTWTPDGKQIIYTHFMLRDADGTGDLYIMNADGTGQTRLTDLPGSEYLPSVSPDGRLIVFVYALNNQSDLYVVGTDGKAPRPLTTTAAAEYMPVWSPDGQRIVFTSNRDGGADHIFVMNADGSNVAQLTHDGQFNWGASWSPDSKQIVFDASHGVNTDIYLMNADGSGLTRITYHTAWDARPSFSPDGTKIIFESWREGRNDLYTINASCLSKPESCDASATNLSNAPALDTSFPQWSPDGTKVLYTAWGYSVTPPSYMREGLGIAGVLIQTALMMSIILFLMRRYRLPLGALTIVMTVNALGMSMLGDTQPLILSALVAGIAADILSVLLKPSAQRKGHFYLFAFLVPVVYFALYFTAILILQGGIAWSPTLWLGAIVISGVLGLFISFLLLPPLMDASARAAHA